jgi:hypothetical protein
MPAVLLFPLPGLLEEIARQRGRVDVAAWRQPDREGEIWIAVIVGGDYALPARGETRASVPASVVLPDLPLPPNRNFH